MNEVLLDLGSWMVLIFDLTYKVRKLMALSSSLKNR